MGYQYGQSTAWQNPVHADATYKRPANQSPGEALVNDLTYTGTRANNAYNWGGTAQAAGRDIYRKNDAAEQIQKREAPQANYGDADFARALGMGARGSQADAMGMYRDAALGNGTSVAQAQFAQALQAQQREQASLAASTRGGGLQRAAAQRMAMTNSADMGANSAAASAALRAQEIAQARAGYGGMAGQMRGQDMGLQGQDASQAQFQAQQQLGGRNANDAMTQFYSGQAMDIGRAQMGGAVGREQAVQDATRANQQQYAVADQHALEQRKALSGAIMNATSSVATAGMASDERVKEDIQRVDGKIDSFLEALSAADYKYKDPGQPGASPGRHTSVMAQDLEKSELGRRMVHDTPSGKMVDYKEGFATMLAAQASLKKELGDLKSALAAKHGRKAA